MEHEEQFVICSNESHEEVGNEEHIEYKVKLRRDNLIKSQRIS